jgi:hypothetical protein
METENTQRIGAVNAQETKATLVLGGTGKTGVWAGAL